MSERQNQPFSTWTELRDFLRNRVVDPQSQSEALQGSGSMPEAIECALELDSERAQAQERAAKAMSTGREAVGAAWRMTGSLYDDDPIVPTSRGQAGPSVEAPHKSKTVPDIGVVPHTGEMRYDPADILRGLGGEITEEPEQNQSANYHELDDDPLSGEFTEEKPAVKIEAVPGSSLSYAAVLRIFENNRPDTEYDGEEYDPLLNIPDKRIRQHEQAQLETLGVRLAGSMERPFLGRDALTEVQVKSIINSVTTKGRYPSYINYGGISKSLGRQFERPGRAEAKLLDTASKIVRIPATAITSIRLARKVQQADRLEEGWEELPHEDQPHSLLEVMQRVYSVETKQNGRTVKEVKAIPIEILNDLAARARQTAEILSKDNIAVPEVRVGSADGRLKIEIVLDVGRLDTKEYTRFLSRFYSNDQLPVSFKAGHIIIDRGS